MNQVTAETPSIPLPPPIRILSVTSSAQETPTSTAVLETDLSCTSGQPHSQAPARAHRPLLFPPLLELHLPHPVSARPPPLRQFHPSLVSPPVGNTVDATRKEPPAAPSPSSRLVARLTLSTTASTLVLPKATQSPGWSTRSNASAITRSRMEEYPPTMRPNVA